MREQEDAERHSILQDVTDSAAEDVRTGASHITVPEVVHAAREEMAQRQSDVVLRRIERGMPGALDDRDLERCAAIMARELGWSRERTQEELTRTKAAMSSWRRKG